MRAALAPVLFATLTVACNSLVGWGDLKEVQDTDTGPSTDGGPGPKRDGGTTPTSEAGTVDAGPRCDPSKDFGTPVKISLDGSGIEAGATLSSDELTMFFQKGALQGATTIVKTTRDSRDVDNWSSPEAVTSLNDGEAGGYPSIVPDATAIFWAQAVETSGRTQIFHSTRTTAALEFGAGQPFGPASSSAKDNAPFITADGKELYFQSNRDNGMHIWRSLRDPGGSYQAPEVVSDLFGPNQAATGDLTEETEVALSFDALTIYFASNRDGGEGQYDIWTAHRTSETAPFTDIAHVANVGSAGIDLPTWVSEDNCVLYLMRLLPNGDPDIMVATRGK